MYKGIGIEPFENKIWLSTPTMHGEEFVYMQKAYDTNWVTTIGENIEEVEKTAAKKAGVAHAVALASCTAAMHLCCKLAGERLYGKPALGHGTLEGRRVFCSDMTFAATVNPVVYEGGIPVFIDTDRNTWNMDPDALEKAFELYPDVKLVISAELYGFPGGMDRIKQVCRKHGAMLIEDAAEAMGADIGGKQCGSFGDLSAVSYNGNKIITGSSGGCVLTDNKEDAEKARKWSTQAREKAPWYQHEEIGCNYRMSNIIAGIIRGQYLHLEEHIAQKRAIYERYKQGLQGLPVEMEPFDELGCSPNFWLSAMTINESAMCFQDRSDTTARYTAEPGKSCPTEILEVLASLNAEGRPIWKPLHMQPVFAGCDYVGTNGLITEGCRDVGADIFRRGVCLPSDNKLTEEQQDKIIAVVRACFE